MKKLTIIVLCLAMLISASACGKKKDDKNAPLRDIPAITSEDEAADDQDAENDTERDDEEAPDASADTSDRTPETDRREIENNLRDAKELIENGDYEDATMIIKSLQTRDLTKSEQERLKELQKMMLKVSD